MLINKDFEWCTKEDNVYTYYFGLSDIPEEWTSVAKAKEEDPYDYYPGGFLLEVKFKRLQMESIEYRVSYTTEYDENVWFEFEPTMEQENDILKCILYNI